MQYEAQILYRCRRCGTVFIKNTKTVSEENSTKVATVIFGEMEVVRHDCRFVAGRGDGFGLADLAGYDLIQIKEPPK